MQRFRSRPIPKYLGIAAGVAIAAGLIPAGASSLGGLDVASVSVVSMAVDIDVNAALVDSQFEGVGSLDGWTDPAGQVWSVVTGRFRGQSGAVRSQDKTAWAAATVDVGVSTGLSVSTLLSGVNPQAGSSGVGLAMLADGNEFVFAVYDRDRQVVEIGTVIGGLAEVLASAAAPDSASPLIEATVAQGEIAVTIDGEFAVSVEVPAGFEMNTAHGIVADNDNQATFEWLRVEALP
jgi:hypothetical protein